MFDIGKCIDIEYKFSSILHILIVFYPLRININKRWSINECQLKFIIIDAV